MHYITLSCTSSPCNLLFLNLGIYSLVQATVGVGTALIWDFCVAYTRGGGVLGNGLLLVVAACNTTQGARYCCLLHDAGHRLLVPFTQHWLLLLVVQWAPCQLLPATHVHRRG